MRWFSCWRRDEEDSSPSDEPPPFSLEVLKALFEYLNRPNPPACTHQLAETSSFLSARGVSLESALDWLRRQGGHCDCEVIYNVYDQWGERVGCLLEGECDDGIEG